MSDKIRNFFLGRVVLEGPWTLFFRFFEIAIVVSIIYGVIYQLACRG